MKTHHLIIILFFMNATLIEAFSQKTDVFQTSKGELVIHFLGHGSLLFEFNHANIYVDPFSRVADYSKLPKADLIFVTHDHQDHFDTVALSEITKQGTEMVFTKICAQSGKYKGHSIVMKNGDKQEIRDISVEAVPAYNIVHKRPDGNPFHPKGDGNGYILGFGDKRIYIAGDTENIPEMKNLGDIDIAFLPMNLPYTMEPEQTADAAKMVHPEILYPYHFGETDVTKLVELLKGTDDIELRLREMK